MKVLLVLLCVFLLVETILPRSLDDFAMAAGLEIQLAEGPAALASSLSWDDAIDRRRIFACLVNGVYMLEADRQQKKQGSATTSSWWRSFHYKVVELTKLMGKGDESKEKAPRIDLAVYEWDHMSRLLRPSKAPKVVIALRGTDYRLKSDLYHDGMALQHLLHESTRFGDTLRVVTNAVEKYGYSKICICGHSLGAALGLMVARTFALDGARIEAHLFNPPFATLSLRNVWSEDAHKVFQLVKTMAAVGLSHYVKDEGTRNKAYEEFVLLEGWRPNLYVNMRDPVCSGYVEYFQSHADLAKTDLAKTKVGGFLSGCVDRFLSDTELGKGGVGAYLSSRAAPFSAAGLLLTSKGEPKHLVPSAYLHVCTSGNGFMESHGLVQWWRRDLDVTSSAVDVGVVKGASPSSSGTSKHS